jgi:nucleoside-diphosphate-sugar epimerase
MRETRRILITGAGGFVCRHIAPALLRQGWQVTAVDRAFDPDVKARWEAEWGERIHCLEADAEMLPPLEVDAVVHGAALTASPEEIGQTPEANFRANIDPMLSMLEWARQNGAGRVILVSSSAVYQETPVGPVSEEKPLTPLGLYAVAKATAEALAETLHIQYNRDVLAVRLSYIYGPGEQPRATRPRTSLVARLIAEALETGQITVYADDPARDWTFAPDVGAAVARLLETPALSHAVYNVAAEQVLSSVELAQAIQAHLPQVRLDIRGGADPAAPPLRRLGYLANRRLAEDTGFNQWTPFADGIGQVIDDFARRAGS